MYQYLNPVDDKLLMRSAGKWAAEKLDYLERLINIFETSMRDKWKVRNYIDLMAGPGKNRIRETTRICLGSPLIALSTKFPFTGYYFIDKNPKNTEALQERCKASPFNNNIHIMTGDSNILVDQILSEISLGNQQSLNLAFLDPEGLELNWKTVEKLAGIGKTDLLINYPQNGLARNMGKVYQASSDSKVDDFYGTREWRIIYSRYKNQNRSKLDRELIDLYKTRLHNLGYLDIKHGYETGGNEPLMRNTKRNAVIYRLIFASKHPLGEKFWNAVTKRDVHGQRRLFDSL